MDRALLVLVLLAAVTAAAVALRGLRRRAAAGRPERFDPADAALGGAATGAVLFSSPWCLACRQWEEALRQAGVDAAKIDVSRHPELARKYGVTATPLVLAVRLADGKVLERYADEPEPGQVERLTALVAKAPA